jgi:hypothetical protein
MKHRIVGSVTTRVRRRFFSTHDQEAKRLWRLDAAHCQDVLDALVEARFLKRTAHGAYARNEGRL